MIPIPPGVRVWISTGPTDMRKGMAGLALQVQEALKRDPHKGDLYVFRGRRGQYTTFYIQFTVCDGRLPLASAIRANLSGVAPPAWQGREVHLHRRAA